MARKRYRKQSVRKESREGKEMGGGEKEEEKRERGEEMTIPFLTLGRCYQLTGPSKDFLTLSLHFMFLYIV